MYGEMAASCAGVSSGLCDVISAVTECMVRWQLLGPVLAIARVRVRVRVRVRGLQPGLMLLSTAMVMRGGARCTTQPKRCDGRHPLPSLSAAVCMLLHDTSCYTQS
jgi:hypothetical protein